MVKMDVVYLKGLGFSNEDTCKITGVCGNTMREYLKQYDEGGIERLKEVNFYKPSSDLQAYSGTIENYFTENPPTSISQAAAIIERLTGIKRGETQVRKFFKSMKFRYIKSYSVPAKALTEEKKTNKENSWKKSLNPD
jgi:transposase